MDKSSKSLKSVIFQKIQDAKKSGIKFVEVSPFVSHSLDVNLLSTYFQNLDQLSCFKFDSSLTRDHLSSSISLFIPGFKETFQVELLEVSSSFYDYIIVASDGEKYSPNKKNKHYRGIVNDNPNSFVAISFLENEIMGVISTNDGNCNLAFNKDLDAYVLYNESNLKEKKNITCGTQSENKPYSSDILLDISRLSTATIVGGCVKIYFETQYDIFLYRGSVPAVEAYVSGLFNQVAAIFENENIGVHISEILVWTSADPYTGTSAASLLAEFQSTRISINGHLGVFLTYKNLGEHGGMSAMVGGLCNPTTANRLSVCQIQNYYNLFPYESWSVYYSS